MVADRRLAGWYYIQIGHTFEIDGDGESAAKQYSLARPRIHQVLSLPMPSTTQSVAKGQEPKNRFHAKLLEIFSNDVRVQNDHITRFERSILPLFDAAASSSQHEEALRSFGELLGFEASRPEQEADTHSTLDDLWVSTNKRQAILFELKTKKRPEQMINAEDVGQGYNHLKWMSQAHKDVSVLGLIFIAPKEKCAREATPSNEMSVTVLGPIREFYEETIQTLLALQRMTPMERYAEIEAMASRPEWQPEAILKRLRGRRLVDVKS